MFEHRVDSFLFGIYGESIIFTLPSWQATPEALRALRERRRGEWPMDSISLGITWLLFEVLFFKSVDCIS